MRITHYVLLIFLLLPLGAQAADLSGPIAPAPYGVFSTISTETPGAGMSAVAFSVEKSAGPDYYRYSSQVSMGITNNMELGLNVPYIDNSVTGIEDINVSLKHRFFEEGKYGPSVAYLLTGTFASNTEELSTGGSMGAGIAVTKRIGPFKAHLNALASHPWDAHLENELRFSGAVDFSASHHFNIMAEFFTRKGYFSNEYDQREVRLGYRFFYKEGVYSTIGVGFGINNTQPEHRIQASLSMVFPSFNPTVERVEEAPK